jgi:hypothetical protein
MYARVICKDGDHDKDVHKQFCDVDNLQLRGRRDVGSYLDSVKSSEHTGIQCSLGWEFMMIDITISL